MERQIALARLRPLEPALRRQGLSALYLFGSVARGDARAGSDVDLAFEVPASRVFSLFDAARLQNNLADALETGVDLVPLEGLRQFVRRRIEPDMIQVF